MHCILARDEAQGDRGNAFQEWEILSVNYFQIWTDSEWSSTAEAYVMMFGHMLINTTTFPNEYYAILLVKIGAILFFCDLFKFYIGCTVADRQSRQFCYKFPTMFLGETDLRFGIYGSKYVRKLCSEVFPTTF